MDLNLVTAFVRVVEAQSFTAAAKSLGLPKSSVSRRVTELEEELGVQLLHRTTRKLSLTEAGRSYFEQAERALMELEAAAELAAGMDSEPRGIVRVLAPVDMALMGLTEVIAEFTNRYPEIHVDLSLSSRVVDIVEEGFDIAIRCGHLRDDSLVSRKLGNTDFGLFASPLYLEKRGTPRSLDDLAEHDCVLLHGKHGKALWRLSGPNDEISTIEVRGRVNCDDLVFVTQAVGIGLGIGLLPVFVAGKCTTHARDTQQRIVRVLPDYAVRGTEVQIVTTSGAKRPKRVTLLRDYLLDNLSLGLERSS